LGNAKASAGIKKADNRFAGMTDQLDGVKNALTEQRLQLLLFKKLLVAHGI